MVLVELKLVHALGIIHAVQLRESVDAQMQPAANNANLITDDVYCRRLMPTGALQRPMERCHQLVIPHQIVTV